MWRPLMDLLSGDPSLELQTVVTSTICNLLLEFSPAKEPMLELGAVEMLCELTNHVDPALRLNGSWALMNMAFQVGMRDGKRRRSLWTSLTRPTHLIDRRSNT